MPLAVFIYSLATQTIDSRRHVIETTEFPPDYLFTILNIDCETSNFQLSMVWPTEKLIFLNEMLARNSSMYIFWNGSDYRIKLNGQNNFEEMVYSARPRISQ